MVMPQALIEERNFLGETPRELFTWEHEELRRSAESWMKEIARTLITTVVLSAVFSMPGGGIKENTGMPNDLEKPLFLVFTISNAIALISSSTSILFFLSILLTPFAEHDFSVSLPLKMISGLVTLFLSILSIIVTIGTSFFVAYYHGLEWLPNFVSQFVLLPLTVVLFLEFSFWFDISYSLYFCMSQFSRRKCVRVRRAEYGCIW